MQYVEVPGSRRATKNVSTGELQVGELHYTVWEESNDATVRNYVETWLPRKYENLVLQDYDHDEDTNAPGQWKIIAKYILPSNSKTQNDGQPVAFTFSTIGGTKHITNGLNGVSQDSEWCDGFKTINGAARPKPDFKANINVGEDGSVEGTDIFAPTLEFGLTYDVLSDFIDVFTLYNISGKVNATQFRGFLRGELLFLGVEGSGEFGPNARGKLTYKFMASPNKYGIVINGCSPVLKYGWHYLWTRSKIKPDAGAKSQFAVPELVMVDQVYEFADFYQLGIL